MSDFWGMKLHYPCGHTALLLDPAHDMTGHLHFCPICHPGRGTCPAELLDVHRESAPLPWLQRMRKQGRPDVE